MTKSEHSLGTKEKILQTANRLFAKYGFGSTSIRDIATEAEVNLAAVNYHFKNKDNLYWEVFEYNFEWTNLGIQSLDDESIDTTELALRTFRFFLNEGLALRNIFKIILSDHVASYENKLDPDKKNNEMFGPPGQSVFLGKINKEVGPGVSEEKKIWAMKTIFSLITHHALLIGTDFFKNKCGQDQAMSPEAFESDIKNAVEAVLTHINK